MLTLSLLALSALATASGSIDPLLQCLAKIQSQSARLVTPSSSDYNQDRFGFNYYFNFNPRAIYYPVTNGDAAAAIRCAASNNVAVAPRSGAHSYEGYGEGGKDGALVIDLEQFKHVSVDSNSGIATIGAGNRLGPLYSALWNSGQYLIPAGTCPSVGIGGHALGGGYGLTARKYGTVSDNIVRMTMINARGEILDVSPSSNKDLFWALRGAGAGSFGLVTEFQIQAYKAPPKVTTFELFYNLTSYSAVIDAYTILGSNATEDFMAEMSVGDYGLDLQGTFLGDQTEATALMTRIIQATGEPQSQNIVEGTWYDAATRWAYLANGTLADPIVGDSRYARGRSLVYRKSLSSEEKDIIYKYINSPPTDASASYLIIDIWGGKMNRPLRPSAFDNHRGVLFGIEFISEFGDVTSGPGLSCASCLSWSQSFIKDMRAAYKSAHLESYQNYIERDVPIETYYGKSLPRLKRVKRCVDPKNVFTFPQAIPLA